MKNSGSNQYSVFGIQYAQIEHRILNTLIFIAITLAVAVLLGFAMTRLTFANAYSCSATYRIEETLPNGSKWEMCWENRAREGIVFYDVYFTTANGVRRKVLAQAGLAQVHVPYDDNGVRFHDITDFGFGAQHLFNLTRHDCETGELIAAESANVMCKHVLSRGFVYADEDGAKLGHMLNLFSVSTVGEYNYIPQWRFYDDGTIEPMMGATGNLQRLSNDAAYGWPVRSNDMRGINHIHNFYWRLDFDLDENGSNEVIEEINVLPSSDNLQRVISTTVLTHETARSIAPEQMRTWRVRDGATTNGAGQSISYELEALHTAHRDEGPSYEAFTHHDLYVTAYNACEQFLTHNPTTDGCGADVISWLNNQGVDGADSVLYFGLTFHHVPRDEDEPNMHTHWSRFRLVPRDWSPSNDLIAQICNTQGMLRHGALEQSAPDSFERELTNMLTYNTPLRERVCALHLQLEALVAANNPIPANTIAEAVGIYSDILSGLTPSNQQWLRTMWQVVEIEQYEGVSAETAWQTVNDTLLPTSVQTSHAESSGGQIVKIYILAALFVASTATFILQFTRRSA